MPAFQHCAQYSRTAKMCEFNYMDKKTKIKFCVSRFLFLIVFLFTKVACGNYKIFENKIIFFSFL